MLLQDLIIRAIERGMPSVDVGIPFADERLIALIDRLPQVFQIFGTLV